jgi:glutamine synthetase
VFTADLIETWIEHEARGHHRPALRPHPHEFEMYFDL